MPDGHDTTDAPGFNPPKQARSRNALRRILDATERLASEREIEQIPLREIAEAAEVSQSTLFARFPTKATLLDHLHGELVKERRSEAYGVLDELDRQDSSLQESAHAIVRAFIRRLRAKGSLERRLIGAGREIASILERERDFQQEALARTREHILRRMPEERRERVAQRLEATITLIMASAPEMTAQRDALMLDSELTDEELAARLVEIAGRAVGTD